jgi:hypothetical protein
MCRLVNPTSLPERRGTICARTRQQTLGALRECQPMIILRTSSVRTQLLDSFLGAVLGLRIIARKSLVRQRVWCDCEVLVDLVICSVL